MGKLVSLEILTKKPSTFISGGSSRKSTSEKQCSIYFYDGENVVGPIFKKNQIQYKNLVSNLLIMNT
ncbi:hypothetical protein [Clostridium algidicarnis]|uniref:hypothetical protein n=1 Tax=Clostridium algidicarnis TaxID=37659 RepID=UPI0014747639|nr:hypothetical protein [Clostridium algidicarnis]